MENYFKMKNEKTIEIGSLIRFINVDLYQGFFLVKEIINIEKGTIRVYSFDENKFFIFYKNWFSLFPNKWEMLA